MWFGVDKQQGFGVSKLPDTPVTSRTNFYSGSTTKAFVAAELSKLVSDDKNHPDIQWTTPINRLIRDDFVLEEDWATNHITLEDALSHRTGMGMHDRAHGRKPTKNTPHDKPRPVLQEIVRQMRYLPMTAEPRTTYQYCNLMYLVVSHVIETVTGTWLGKLLKDHIWTPLGMNGTYFATEDAIAGEEDLAQGYKYNEAKSQYEEVNWMDLDSTSGAGSVISNVEDYAKWIRAFMERPDKLTGIDFEELLRPRTLMASMEPFTGPRAYALGWRTHVYRGHQCFWHTGGMNCFGALVLFVPALKYAFIGLANTAISSNMVEMKIAHHLIDEKLKVPQEERFDWDKHHHDELDKGKERAKNAKKRLYPNLPQEPLPLPRPLKAYAGTYHHPAYRMLVIYHDADKDVLRADREDTTWPEYMTFEHLSGNYFLIWSESEGDYAAWYPDTYAAEFKIGADSIVDSVGITWEPEMGDRKIWLERVQESG